MFGKNSAQDSTRHAGTTLIARGTRVEGEIHFTGCLEIEGEVEGNIVADEHSEAAQVRIQNSGKVNGDVCAPIVIVNSAINGNVYSSSRVELAANAVVCGDVHYQIIEMVKGAQINGGLLYSPAGDEPPSAAAASSAAPESALDEDL